MDLISSDDELIKFLSGDNSLLDSSIGKIEISSDQGLVNVYVWLEMRQSSSEKEIRLCFGSCKNYGFFFSDDHIFYNVERIKCFETDEGLFYVSFDPIDESEEVSEDDQDFVLSRSVAAYRV